MSTDTSESDGIFALIWWFIRFMFSWIFVLWAVNYWLKFFGQTPIEANPGPAFIIALICPHFASLFSVFTIVFNLFY
jgi:hypothetical protein